MVLVLVGVSLQVGAVGIEHPTADQSMFVALFVALFDDAVEDGLLDVGAGIAPAAVLGEGGGIDHLVGEAHPEKPAVGDVDLDFPHQLPFGADAEQVANEQHLEQAHWVQRRAAVVRAVEGRGLVQDEVKPDVPVDQTQEVILRDQFFQPSPFPVRTGSERAASASRN